MPPRRLLALSLATALALGVAGVATAQTSPLQRLHDALRLSAAQEEAWKRFAAAAGPDPETTAQARAAQSMLPTLHAPQRVELSIATLRAELEALERRGAALKAFYAALTPEQQATFDRETLPREDAGGGF